MWEPTACFFIVSHMGNEHIFSLNLLERRRTSCLEHGRYLQFKWLQHNSDTQPLRLPLPNIQPFSQIIKIFEKTIKYPTQISSYKTVLPFDSPKVKMIALLYVVS